MARQRLNVPDLDHTGRLGAGSRDRSNGQRRGAGRKRDKPATCDRVGRCVCAMELRWHLIHHRSSPVCTCQCLRPSSGGQSATAAMIGYIFAGAKECSYVATTGWALCICCLFAMHLDSFTPLPPSTMIGGPPIGGRIDLGKSDPCPTAPCHLAITAWSVHWPQEWPPMLSKQSAPRRGASIVDAGQFDGQLRSRSPESCLIDHERR